jgi:hypothetical protein
MIICSDKEERIKLFKILIPNANNNDMYRFVNKFCEECLQKNKCKKD